MWRLEIVGCGLRVRKVRGWMCEADSSNTAVVQKEVATARHTLTVRSRPGKTFLACFDTHVPASDSTCSVNRATQISKTQ